MKVYELYVDPAYAPCEARLQLRLCAVLVVSRKSVAKQASEAFHGPLRTAVPSAKRTRGYFGIRAVPERLFRQVEKHVRLPARFDEDLFGLGAGSAVKNLGDLAASVFQDPRLPALVPVYDHVFARGDVL